MTDVQRVGSEQFENIFNAFPRMPKGHKHDILVGIYSSCNHKYFEFEGKDRSHSFIEYKAEA